MRNTKHLLKHGASFAIVPIIVMCIYLLAIIGEIRCIYKACTCNWEPIGKAEVIYTVSAATGLGVVVGFVEINDK